MLISASLPTRNSIFSYIFLKFPFESVFPYFTVHILVLFFPVTINSVRYDIERHQYPKYIFMLYTVHYSVYFNRKDILVLSARHYFKYLMSFYNLPLRSSPRGEWPCLDSLPSSWNNSVGYHLGEFSVSVATLVWSNPLGLFHF